MVMHQGCECQGECSSALSSWGVSGESHGVGEGSWRGVGMKGMVKNLDLCIPIPSTPRCVPLPPPPPFKTHTSLEPLIPSTPNLCPNFPYSTYRTLSRHS